MACWASQAEALKGPPLREASMAVAAGGEGHSKATTGCLWRFRVYCSMFRRPLLGMLNSVWSFIVELNAEPPVVKQELPATVR